MLDRLILCVLLVTLVIVGAVLWFLYQVLAPYVGMIGQGFSFVFLTVTFCMVLLIAGLSYQLLRFVNAWVENKIQHIPLVTWKPGEGAIYIHPETGVYHASAMDKSAAISTYALQVETDRVKNEHAIEDIHREALLNDSDENKIHKIQNLLTQGKTATEIEKHTGITRYHQRRLLKQ